MGELVVATPDQLLPLNDTQFSLAVAMDAQAHLEHAGEVAPLGDAQDGDVGLSSSAGGASEPDSSHDASLLDSYLQSQGVSSASLTGRNESCSQEGGSKAQICFDFTKGLCTRGDKCKYSHDLATIVHFNSKEKGICFDYLRNQCHRGLLCRFSHDLSNIAQQCQVIHGAAAARGRTNAICYDFVKGVCQRGNECRYSHDLSLIARTARGGTNGARSGEVCYDYLRGRCNRGTSCKYSHNISFLGGPGFLPNGISNGGSSIDDSQGTSGGGGMAGSQDQLQMSMLNPSLSADPATISAMAVAAQSGPKLMQHLAGSSTDMADRRGLASSLSAELSDTLAGHMDQPPPSMWHPSAAAVAASNQAAMLSAVAVQQRQFAAGMAGGYGPMAQAALAQQMAAAGPAAAAVAAATAAAAQQGQHMMAKTAAAAAAAAAVQQQQQHAAAAMRAMMGQAPAPPAMTNAIAAAAQQAVAVHQAAQLVQAQRMAPQGLPGPMPTSGTPPGLTAESISAILSNLRPDNPSLMAETLTGLAAAAQAQAAQAHHARMVVGAAQAAAQHVAVQQQAHAQMMMSQQAEMQAAQAAAQQQRQVMPMHSSVPPMPSRHEPGPEAACYSSDCGYGFSSQPQPPFVPPPPPNGIMPPPPPQQPGCYSSGGSAPVPIVSSEAPMLPPQRASQPSIGGQSVGSHSSSGGAPVHSNDPSVTLSSDLLPLLKEIWNK